MKNLSIMEGVRRIYLSLLRTLAVNIHPCWYPGKRSSLQCILALLGNGNFLSWSGKQGSTTSKLATRSWHFEGITPTGSVCCVMLELGMSEMVRPVMAHVSCGLVDLLGLISEGFDTLNSLGGLAFLLGALLPPAGATTARLVRRLWNMDWELFLMAALTTIPLYYVDWRLFVGSVVMTTVVYKSVTSILRRYVRQYIRQCIRFYMRQFAMNTRLVRRILDDGDGEEELPDEEPEEEPEARRDVAWFALVEPTSWPASRRVRVRSSFTLPHSLEQPLL